MCAITAFITFSIYTATVEPTTLSGQIAAVEQSSSQYTLLPGFASEGTSLSCSMNTPALPRRRRRLDEVCEKSECLQLLVLVAQQVFRAKDGAAEVLAVGQTTESR
ncbi:hypothetical protein MRX96_006199 [Rhipicephalus microplus]